MVGLRRDPMSRSDGSGLIWVVEDSPLEAEMARRALAMQHRVDVFGDGPAVLERIANGERPDAIVLDSQLPTIMGVEVCRFVRATFDETALPILMLTVEGNRGSIVEALSAGANDYLLKPYDVAELLARVGVLVRTSLLHLAQERRAGHFALAADVGRALARGGDDAELAQTCASLVARHLDAPLAALFTENHGSVSLTTASGSAATGATAPI